MDERRERLLHRTMLPEPLPSASSNQHGPDDSASNSSARDYTSTDPAPALRLPTQPDWSPADEHLEDGFTVHPQGVEEFQTDSIVHPSSEEEIHDYPSSAAAFAVTQAALHVRAFESRCATGNIFTTYDKVREFLHDFLDILSEQVDLARSCNSSLGEGHSTPNWTSASRENIRHLRAALSHEA